MNEGASSQKRRNHTRDELHKKRTLTKVAPHFLKRRIFSFATSFSHFGHHPLETFQAAYLHEYLLFLAQTFRSAKQVKAIEIAE